MIKIFEDDEKTILSDEVQVVTEYKNGGRTTTLKHDTSWHENNPEWCKSSPCIYCKNNQPERSKREDLTSISDLPKDLERYLIESWKRDLLS